MGRGEELCGWVLAPAPTSPPTSNLAPRWSDSARDPGLYWRGAKRKTASFGVHRLLTPKSNFEGLTRKWVKATTSVPEPPVSVPDKANPSSSWRWRDAREPLRGEKGSLLGRPSIGMTAIPEARLISRPPSMNALADNFGAKCQNTSMRLGVRPTTCLANQMVQPTFRWEWLSGDLLFWLVSSETQRTHTPTISASSPPLGERGEPKYAGSPLVFLCFS